jgi:aminoglycoside phosphotransferase (APT) family kinase protein
MNAQARSEIEELNVAALGAWMDARGLGSGPLTGFAPLGGGTQNIMLRFERAGRRYVLRRPPEHLRSNSNEAMRREARLLAALRDSGVPHPRLIAAESGTDALGVAFYLMEPVDGFNPTTGLPPLHASSEALRHRMGLALVEGIARLGELDHVALGLADFGRADGFLERQVPRWCSQLDGYREHAGWPGPDALPGVAQVAQWLESRRPRSFRPGLMHGDFHLANVMFRYEDAELAAIVDWELATVGDPLLDLGWLLAVWPDAETVAAGNTSVRPWSGFPTADQLVEHYGARSSRGLEDLGWYRVLACFKLGILLEGTHARACAGLAPRDTGDALHARAVRLFQRALAWTGAAA